MATLRVIVQTSYKIFNEKLGFPIPLPYFFYTHICITLLSVLAELFAYEAAIVLVFQRSLVLYLDKDNIKSIKMFVGVSTSSKRCMSADILYRSSILTTLDLLCNSVEYVISNSLF